MFYDRWLSLRTTNQD